MIYSNTGKVEPWPLVCILVPEKKNFFVDRYMRLIGPLYVLSVRPQDWLLTTDVALLICYDIRL